MMLLVQMAMKQKKMNLALKCFDFFWSIEGSN